ncbi:MAG: tRNA (uridine(34)/cytosine(34)/5-carboxymethylaminomethyluridine(34)-2'-O)-methyltransferase TrmL [Clostridiaceae bacterium]|nr:tRNA (uridine(34)/cytosine(34)/5-carboxymethylaminomethyluridine(34)-2'-O)-methyltransferase TrmL [Clostridiaceae bacterium]
MLNVVLLEPEIPQNTGNISRTCAATGCSLHLVGPLGFSLADRYLKRAGLDYWNLLDLHVYDDWTAFRAAHPEARPWMATTKGAANYCDVQYSDGDWLLFGKETRGLPEHMLAADYERAIRLPMRAEARSLNLSNSVAVVVYEALRQTGFPDLQKIGYLPDKA